MSDCVKFIMSENCIINFLIREGKGKGKSKGKAEGEGKGKEVSTEVIPADYRMYNKKSTQP